MAIAVRMTLRRIWVWLWQRQYTVTQYSVHSAQRIKLGAAYECTVY